jgi:hypothetical protein
MARFSRICAYNNNVEPDWETHLLRLIVDNSHSKILVQSGWKVKKKK